MRGIGSPLPLGALCLSFASNRNHITQCERAYEPQRNAMWRVPSLFRLCSVALPSPQDSPVARRSSLVAEVICDVARDCVQAS